MAESKEKKIQTAKMPVLFIGHGSPLNIISKNSYTDSLARLAKDLPLPRAIMVISAHWLTDGTHVGCMPKPRTIYDFYGFPQELYRIHYPSPGAPECAELVSKLISSIEVKCDMGWGLDHASWSVLRHMYPKADIPVFEMSLHYSFNEWHPLPLQYHYDLAAGISELRRNGVLIMGSGNIVHNLGLIDFEDTDARPYDWAVEFDEKVKSNLIDRNHRDLINFQSMGKSARLAVPTLDHYLPMIYAIALQEKNEPLTFTHEGFQNASVSMRCFRIG
ncbi:MAG: 4,5-DOPA dioxygenase extradiol [Dehalococcoidia bacterium]